MESFLEAFSEQGKSAFKGLKEMPSRDYNGR